VVLKNVLDNIAHFLLQALGNVLAECRFRRGSWWHRNRLSQSRMMLIVGEADLAVELETAVERRDTFT
jgi:hypothetical protein